MASKKLESKDSRMPSQFRQTCYFDTSALNRLHDVKNRSSVLALMQKRFSTCISGFVVVECIGTSNASRRSSLLRLVATIQEDALPLADPSVILHRSLSAHLRDAYSYRNSIGTEQLAMLDLYEDPGNLHANADNLAQQWNQHQKNWYEAMHREGRPKMQTVLDRVQYLSKRPLSGSFSAFLSALVSDHNFLRSIVNQFAVPLARQSLSTEGALRILNILEPWRMFFAGFAYGIYRRSVRRQGHGRRRNPGTVDTLQTIYLGECDVFVSADKSHLRMMKLLNMIGRNRRQVVSFEKFHDLLCH